MTPTVVLRELTPPGVPAGEDLRVVEQRLAALPHTITLAEGLTLVVTLPTGVARAWLHPAGDAVVSSGAVQQRAHEPPAAPLPEDVDGPVGPGDGRLPATGLRPRLLVVRDRRPLAAFPAVVGHAWVIAGGDAPGERALEVAVLDWHVDVATVLGLPSAAGSLRVAWRWLDEVATPPRLPEMVDVAWASWSAGAGKGGWT